MNATRHHVLVILGVLGFALVVTAHLVVGTAAVATVRWTVGTFAAAALVILAKIAIVGLIRRYRPRRLDRDTSATRGPGALSQMAENTASPTSPLHEGLRNQCGETSRLGRPTEPVRGD